MRDAEGGAFCTDEHTQDSRAAQLVKLSQRKSRWDHLLLARDLKLLKLADCTELARQTIEVKRMLTGLIQKLTADR